MVFLNTVGHLAASRRAKDLVDSISFLVSQQPLEACTLISKGSGCPERCSNCPHQTGSRPHSRGPQGLAPLAWLIPWAGSFFAEGTVLRTVGVQQHPGLQTLDASSLPSSSDSSKNCLHPLPNAPKGAKTSPGKEQPRDFLKSNSTVSQSHRKGLSLLTTALLQTPIY